MLSFQPMMKRWIRSMLSAFAIVFISNTAFAQTCTLLRVKTTEEAKLRVYFTKFMKEDNTEGRYRECKVVDRALQGTESFFVTPFRQDATIVVHPTNWPSG